MLEGPWTQVVTLETCLEKKTLALACAIGEQARGNVHPNRLAEPGLLHCSHIPVPNDLHMARMAQLPGPGTR